MLATSKATTGFCNLAKANELVGSVADDDAYDEDGELVVKGFML